MPQSLPWFNNAVDPLLPDGIGVPIKLEIYKWDDYQSYDVILYDRITISLNIPLLVNFALQNLRNANNSIGFENVHNPILFDRFTPWDYPWCEEYSTKIYNFLKPLTATDYYNSAASPFVNLVNYGVQSQIIDLDTFKFSYTSITLDITNVKNRGNAIITWMHRDDETKADFSKQYQIINSWQKSNNILLKMDLKYLLTCSVVVSGDDSTLVSEIENQLDFSKGILYKHLDELINKIQNHINTNFPQLYKVVSSRTYTNTITIDQPMLYANNIDGHSYGAFTWYEYRQIQTIDSETYINKPDWHYSAGIFYANNNPWNTNIPLRADLGKNILPRLDGYGHLSKPPKRLDQLLKSKDSFDLIGSTGGQWHVLESNLLWYPQTKHYFKFMPQSGEVPPGYSGQQTEFIINNSGMGKNSDYNEDYINVLYNDGSKVAPSLLKGTTPAYFIGGMFIKIQQNPIGVTDYYVWKISANTNDELYNTNNISALEITRDELIYLGRWEEGTAPQQFVDSETVTFTTSYQYYNNENDYVKSDYYTPITKGQYLTILDDYKYKLTSSGELQNTMPDSLRIKETREIVEKLKNVLGTEEHELATAGGTNPENLYYDMVRVRQVLGIEFEPKSRAIRPIRQRGKIKAGDPIPQGWNFGQWGENIGEQYQKGTTPGTAIGIRNGMVIENIPNEVSINKFSGKKEIKGGDLTLIENLPQMFIEFMDQFDKSIGMQSAGGNYIPAADGSGKIFIYEGLHQLLIEVAYNVSKLTEITAQTQISSMVSQGLLYEVLMATGVPTAPKGLSVDLGGKKLAKIPYPAVAVDAPTLTAQLGWILHNLSIIVGKTVT